VITDLGNGRAASQTAIVPTPACIKPRRVAQPAALPAAAAEAQPAAQISLAGTESSRVTMRAALYAALTGVRLSSKDRQFLSRLVHWDKRNAASIASLIWRARQAGREETALTPRQLEIVLAALDDAAAYRISGNAADGCWDCEKIPGGRCGDHARDNDRARAYAEAAAVMAANGVISGSAVRANTLFSGNAVLSGSSVRSGAVLPGAGQDGRPQPRKIGGYRRRTPVAS